MRRYSNAILLALFSFSATISLDAAMAVEPESAVPGLANQEFGFFGPLSLGMKYDSLLGSIFNANLVQTIGDTSAVGVIGEYGAKQNRLNATLGFQAYSAGLMKFSAEYLSQVLPFGFDSGNINQRVSQMAYGWRFQQSLSQTFLQNMNGGVYWAKAPNNSLSSLYFVGADSVNYLNQRNIAGSISQGMDLGGVLLFSDMTSLETNVNYDRVNYSTQLISSSVYNRQGVGATVKLNQLITDHLKFSAQALDRALYKSYEFNLDYLPHVVASADMKLGLAIQHLVSSNQVPSSNTVGLEFTYSDSRSEAARYSLSAAQSPDLKDWVKVPAVYLQRVMAEAEQVSIAVPGLRTHHLGSGIPGPAVTGISPGSAATGQASVAITLTGTYFAAGDSVMVIKHGTEEGEGETIPVNDVSIVNANTITTRFDLSHVTPGTYDVSVRMPSCAHSLCAAPPVSIPFTVTAAEGSTGMSTDAKIAAISGAAVLGSGAAIHFWPSQSVLPNLSGPLSTDFGSVQGGAQVTLKGSYLGKTSEVLFGGSPAKIISVSSEAVTVVTPPHVAGTVDLKIVAEGERSFENAYTYQ